jgi:hypothetical protein
MTPGIWRSLVPEWERMGASPGLYTLRKNSCFVSGHDFSRAVKSHSYEGFSPWAFSFSCASPRTFSPGERIFQTRANNSVAEIEGLPSPKNSERAPKINIAPII